MIGGQGEDSCGKSEIGETPQKAKACTEINSSVTNDLYLPIYPICSSIDLVMSQSLFS
ncbi:MULTISPECIES: hypothetical protein [Priestia]|uniref:hypothetical protein n=1 Tax=Priestia TaxID=2800373 RepID=UPI0018A2C54F|nr:MULTISPECIES: hypothetical protein [Priestia]MDR7241205.1 hypothetical protein [Priestia megaterium]QTL51535.1 hypothetical protein J5Z55_10855 [Priestia aryabhattai]